MIFKQNSCQVIFYSIFIFSALKAEINIFSSFNLKLKLKKIHENIKINSYYSAFKSEK
jgi:hypothetical protein